MDYENIAKITKNKKIETYIRNISISYVYCLLVTIP